MAKPDLVIDSAASLQRLQGEVWHILFRRFGDVKVDAAQLSDDDNALWTRRLRSVYFACGCNEGKVTGTAGVIGVLVWLFERPGDFATLQWTDLVIGAAIVLASAATGKIIALTLARRQLNRWIRVLEGALASPASAAPH